MARQGGGPARIPRVTRAGASPAVDAFPAGQATIAAAALRPYRRLVALLPEAQRLRLENETGAILSHAGLSWLDVSDRPDVRVAHATCAAMLDAAVAMTGAPALGLFAAEAWREGDFDLCEWLVRSSATVGDAIEATRRYLPLIVDADLEVVREGRWLVVRLSFAPDLRVPQALVDQVMATIRLLTVRYARDARTLRVEMHLRQARPEYAAEYRRILDVDPKFARPHDAFVVPMELTALPMRDANRTLFGVLRRQADAELGALKRHQSLSHRVREAIERELPGGAHLPAVAGALGLGAQTLHRRLIEQGTTYRVLLEQVRRDLASRLLEDPRCSMSDIAYRLGFAQPPSFHRAFKRWFGTAPNEYRAARRPRLDE